jgi:hypothetical protein
MRNLRLERASPQRQTPLPPSRSMPPARAHRELGRRPRLPVPGARPPYIELAVTALAFMFLVFVVLGGLSPG